MVSTGLTNVGEEWMQKFAFRQDTLGTRDTTADFLLYLDSTDYDDDGTVEGDQLTESGDIGAVTTEPNDGNYARVTLNLDSADFALAVASGDLRVRAQPSFDVTSTTGYVDAWGMVVDFQSDVVNSETGQNPHLVAAGKFSGGALNLEQSTTVNVNADTTLN